MIDTFMIVDDMFSGWMHIYGSGMVRIEVRYAGNGLTNIVRQFPNEEQAEQWLDEFGSYLTMGGGA